MQVRIRLQKAGAKAKKRYNYRIVAIGRTKSRQSKALDILGYYDAAKKPSVYAINQEKIDKWLKNGAQMTSTVKTLLKKSKQK